MRSTLRIIFLLFTALLSGCIQPKGGVHFGEAVYEPNYAEGFEIVAAEGKSTVLRIKRPWQGADTAATVKELFIARDDEKAPEGFVGTVVKSSPQRVACMSSSHIAFLDMLGQTQTIVGVSGAEYVSNPTVSAGWRDGRVREMGYDANVNYELLASLKPDIVFIYGTSGENTALVSKLSELKIPYIYIGDHTEHSALGKSEWLVAFGEIFDRRAEAEALFNDIAERYESLRISALQYSSRPKVMLNAPYRDIWFVPADNSYIVGLIRDAGGEYICAGGSGEVSRPISGESAYIYVSQADIWLNPNVARSIADVVAQNPKFAQVKAVRERKVYNCTARSTANGGSDFWESGAVRADLVLADMIAIIHPENSICRGGYYFERLK